ncbi:OmpA-OmpF porin, OOP family [Alteromonadaceae bacterium Bs31]|nr:OmpA-OmpF porin, OOP family [Alteromonadaceae bacterium Bs31]
MSVFKTKRLAVAIASLALMQPAFAQKKYELGAGAVYSMFAVEDSINVKDGYGLRGLIGTRPSDHWGFELVWDSIVSETESSSALDSDVDFNQIYANALYHFNIDSNLQPYISVGFGQGVMEFEEFDSTERSKQANMGVGLKWYVNENWIVRPAINYFVNDNWDPDHAVVGLTLSYAWGDKMSKAAPVVVAAALVDTDKDGVEDGTDKCPATPAGIPVDSSGCPLDSDADGVYDYQDDCPATEAHLKVDEAGCPVILSETVSKDLQITFDSNSDVVKQEFYDEVQQVADFLQQYVGTEVVIEGHTDSSGAASYNKDLSERRAAAVAKVLTEEMGVDAGRVSSVGFGEEQPVADESTREGRMANRRVVAKVSANVEKMEQK